MDVRRTSAVVYRGDCSCKNRAADENMIFRFRVHENNPEIKICGFKLEQFS